MYLHFIIDHIVYCGRVIVGGDTIVVASSRRLGSSLKHLLRALRGCAGGRFLACRHPAAPIANTANWRRRGDLVLVCALLFAELGSPILEPDLKLMSLNE